MKSKGHIGFTVTHEYLRHGNEIFRSPIDAPMGVNGIRLGLRFESYLAPWNALGWKLVTFVGDEEARR